MDYKIKDRSAKVAKRRNPGMVVSNRSLKTILIERAAKAQAGPKGCTSDDPRNHQGATCPIHESHPRYAAIRMGLG